VTLQTRSRPAVGNWPVGNCLSLSNGHRTEGGTPSRTAGLVTLVSRHRCRLWDLISNNLPMSFQSVWRSHTTHTYC